MADPVPEIPGGAKRAFRPRRHLRKSPRSRAGGCSPGLRKYRRFLLLVVLPLAAVIGGADVLSQRRAVT